MLGNSGSARRWRSRRPRSPWDTRGNWWFRSPLLSSMSHCTDATGAGYSEPFTGRTGIETVVRHTGGIYAPAMSSRYGTLVPPGTAVMAIPAYEDDDRRHALRLPTATAVPPRLSLASGHPKTAKTRDRLCSAVTSRSRRFYSASCRRRSIDRHEAFSSEDSPLITDHRLDFGAYPSTVCGRRNRGVRERRRLAARQSCEARNPTIMPDVRRRSIAHDAADDPRDNGHDERAEHRPPEPVHQHANTEQTDCQP